MPNTLEKWKTWTRQQTDLFYCIHDNDITFSKTLVAFHRRCGLPDHFDVNMLLRLVHHEDQGRLIEIASTMIKTRPHVVEIARFRLQIVPGIFEAFTSKCALIEHPHHLIYVGHTLLLHETHIPA
ncbi:MAG: hypothetical protein V9H26_03295 [Verrucomicrobiota bacterium]